MIRIRAGLLVLAGALALISCSPAENPAPAPPRIDETPITDRPTLPDGIIATGELRDAAGAVLGTVRIIGEGRSAFTVEIPLDGLGATRPVAMLSDGSAPTDGCVSWEDFQLELGDAARWTQGFGEETGDPSYWRHLLVAGVGGDACPQPLIAAASLTWQLPSMRPGLAVVDGGRIPAARGPVLYDADDRPLVYRTVSGDTWSAIAQRFGITEDDLGYLNPHRTGGSDPGVAYELQLLNLDPANRGDSESRRMGGDLSMSEEFR